MTRILALFVALGLSACAAHQRAETAQRAKDELVGLKKSELLACAGAPARSAVSEDIEVLTYEGGGDSRGVGVGTATRGLAVGTISSYRRYCEVTFVLRGGVVDKVNYAGRTGGLATKGEQCAFVVENCVSAR
jgi:hypothetical protein